MRGGSIQEKLEWFIGIRPVLPFSPLKFLTTGFTCLYPPAYLCYADPFVVSHRQKDYIFFESYDVRDMKGSLLCAEIDDGEIGPLQTILSKGYHLSYPLVFEDNGELYLLPESAKNKTIELYRALDFPSRWECVGTILDQVDAVDSTLFKHNGYYWLFTNTRTGEPHRHFELHLFYAKNLMGPWISHPQNPVVNDASCSRPAGNIIVWEGRMIRPAQDCSRIYGEKICWQEITILTTQQYGETTLAVVSPDWHPQAFGTHTYNRNDRYEVIDAIRKINYPT